MKSDVAGNFFIKRNFNKICDFCKNFLKNICKSIYILAGKIYSSSFWYKKKMK